MPGTTTSDRGAIVLVRFVFADENGAKRRPVLILSTERYHAGRREVVVAAITSSVDRLLVGDHRIEAWRQAGLPLPSVVTGIVSTIKRDMIEAGLGVLDATDLLAVERNLRASLGLRGRQTAV